jgi:hypothetical protein
VSETLFALAEDSGAPSAVVQLQQSGSPR